MSQNVKIITIIREQLVMIIKHSKVKEFVLLSIGCFSKYMHTWTIFRLQSLKYELWKAYIHLKWRENFPERYNCFKMITGTKC